MTAPILMAALCSFWGCDKDEDHLSEAVLASANTLNFEAERAAEKIITIYADADWVTEVPDWVTVTPNSGTGVMDVTVSVTDNMRDGAEDNPRKATLVFKGRTLASRAQVLITQNGDKYRDVKEYTAGELAALADETVISVPSAIVVAVTTKGFVISDDKNTDNIFVSDATTVAVGDKISLLGTKSSDSQKLATVIDCDEVTVLSGGSALCTMLVTLTLAGTSASCAAGYRHAKPARSASTSAGAAGAASSGASSGVSGVSGSGRASCTVMLISLSLNTKGSSRSPACLRSGPPKGCTSSAARSQSAKLFACWCSVSPAPAARKAAAFASGFVDLEMPSGTVRISLSCARVRATYKRRICSLRISWACTLERAV